MSSTGFDFVGRWRTWLIASSTTIAISVIALLVFGLNLSIDFVGGTSFVLEDIADDITADQLRTAAEGVGAVGVTAQITSADTETPGAIVRMGAIDPGSQELVAVRDALEEVASPGSIAENFVGPSWGAHVSRKALQALVVFLVVVVLYITIRLEFKMAVVSVIALLHDVVITVGAYALFRFNVSPATIIALLTILGYSLYDSMVIFDRVDENSAHLGEPGRRTMAQVVNVSMNDVLWRSINTTLTSIFPVGALLFLGAQLLGASTLEDLALALFLGMALGAYSSLFVAGPLLAHWKMREPEQQRLAARAIELGEEDAARGALPTEEVTRSRAPITTTYVRGRGRPPRRRR